MSAKTANREGTKESVYKAIVPQIKSLLENENYLISNMANVCAVLKSNFDYFWVGFYVVEGDELRLGPFQGPIACTRIRYGRGVCGTSWQNKETIIVPDVHSFPGHIACNAASKSEIVVPLLRNESVIAILDVDSDQLNFFDEIDKKYLETIVALLGKNE